MATQIDVYNLALTHLDISQTVQSINDNSPAAGTMNRFWDLARRKVLESAHWGFATKAAALDAMSDAYVTAEYRKHLARILTFRALEKATGARMETAA